MTFHVRLQEGHSVRRPDLRLQRAFLGVRELHGIFKPQNSRDINGQYLDPIDGNSFEFGIKGEHFDGASILRSRCSRRARTTSPTPVFDPETGEPIVLPDGTQASQRDRRHAYARLRVRSRRAP